MALVDRFTHRRFARLVTGRAAGTLTPLDARVVEAHLGTCARCRVQAAEEEGLRALLSADAATLGAALPIPVSALVTRVHAALDTPAAGPRSPWLVALGSAAATVAVAAVFWTAPARAPRPAGPEPAAVAAAIPEDMFDRAERRLAREQAARYLAEAQDVLLTVAATPPRCRKGENRVDVGDEAARSRALLARRAMAVPDAESVGSAQPLLEDVERVLREVASLDPCARPQDLKAIHEEIAKDRLLMKIDLVTRELVG